MMDKPGDIKRLLDSKGLCVPEGGIPRKKNAHKNARDRGKTWEREIAKALNTKRTGPTGLNDADVIHPTLAIEAKALARLGFRREHWNQAKTNAKGRVPVLLIKELHTGERIAILPYDYFIKLHTEELDNG